MAFGSGTKSYKPGELVPSAGVYRVLHQEHRSSHNAAFEANDIFPACRQCGEAVRFELVLPGEDSSQVEDT